MLLILFNLNNHYFIITGSVFECSGSLDSELSRRVQLAADMLRRLQRPLFQQKCISLKTRMVVCKCMVTSILLYGSEAWDVSRVRLLHVWCGVSSWH